MSSAKVQKINAKSTSTPFIKKLYESPKKWLAGDKSKSKRDIVIVHRKTDHIYENIEFSKKQPEQNIKENVTVVKVPYDKNQSNKLRIIIDNFDKILDEYGKTEKPIASSTPVKNPPSLPSQGKSETKIPKLIKSKTCSIIESKCILKKSHSNPFDPNNTNNAQPKLIHKTKSLCNIQNIQQDSKKPLQKEFSKLPTPSEQKNPKEEKGIEPLSDIKDKDKNIEAVTNVKEIVKRLNSLTDSKEEDATVDTSRSVSKAKSTLDLSSTKLTLASRIPVNTTLRKAYPSIPCDLNSLDLYRGNAGAKNLSLNGKFAKSSQNLSCTKLSLPKNNKAAQNLPKKGKSTQNLSIVGKPTENNFAKSVQNLNKLVPCYNTLTKTNNTRSVQNLAPKLQNKSVVNLKQMKQTNSSKTVKPILNKTVEYKQPISKTNHGISVSKSIEKLTSIGQIENVAPKDTFIVLKAQKEKVKNVIQQLEETKYVNNSEAKGRQLRTDTFRVPPKNNSKSTNNPTKLTLVSKNTKAPNGNDSKKQQSETIKLNLKNTKRFLEKLKLECNENLNYEFDTDCGNDEVDYVKEKHIPKDSTLKKDLDYNSDNSDDSGNISNEIELDCEDTNSSSSIKSAESFNTVLDISLKDQDSGIDLKEGRKGLTTQESEKVFFRNGVISQLETQRDERLAGMVVQLQANCRGYLARKKLAQKKLQDLAVRCIQRNVRKFIAVRDWPWWRLLVRVTPLLNVYRTEEELKIKTNELELIKSKLEKLESERTKLKHDNDKLEAKLSEMTADLAEEHSTATLAAERLDAETSERLKLEKELNDVNSKNKELQQSSERLELELLYTRSDLNGISEEDEDGEGDGGVYKQRYERALKELEFTKRRLQQQHEDDLEQLIGLKKQLEKKLADAYEEVEEQRQVVGQWKRKVQKLNGEMNDLKLLLEEQNGRNNLLEKKQRKFDSESQMLHDELKKERQIKERFAREKEICMAEKFAIESTLADTRMELELKEEKLLALQREFEEVTCGGKTEEEVTTLRKQKIDCERRLQDQEEELDELAGQVQLLEQAKLRLEMTLESMRKEAKKEAQLRDEELEEVRCNAQKKVKAFEQQLENEHEERTLLLREKHELERRLQAAAELERHDRAGDEALLQRLKRDLKRTKALLRDTQAQLERQKSEAPGKATIRQLRNQLEDLECARSMAVKAKQSLETDLLETQSQLEESHKLRQEAEERANHLLREKSDLQSQLEENEEELAEVLKKFKGTVQQMSLDQMAFQEQVSLVSELEIERNHLKEQLAELTTKLESVESMGESSSNLLVRRSELKVKELESKLELEQTTRSRLEVQISRLKEAVEKVQQDLAGARLKEQQSQDQVRKLQRQLREVKEELNKSLAKESEVIIKKKELEKRCESLEAESATARTDLRLALTRIEDLQSAIQGELEDTISDNSDSEQETYSSDDSVNKYLANHKPTKSEKSSSVIDSRRLSNVSRSSTSSNLGKDLSYT